jgi:ribosomal protein L2
MLPQRIWTRLSKIQLNNPFPWTCPRCTTSQVRWASKPARKPKTDKRIQEVTNQPSDAHLVRRYKPRTPGQRHLVRPINNHLWKGGPYRPLTYPRKGQHIGGRNNTGRITVRHRGGGAKRRIRIVDFKRQDPGQHRIVRIEYDPGRSAHIALVQSAENQKNSYILVADGLREGDTVQSYRAGIPQSLIDSIGGVYDPALIAAKTTIRGNCLPLHMIPPGTNVFNIGMRKTGGGQLCRSAGTFGTIVQPPDLHREKYPNYVLVKLQSGETRSIHREACATIGVASNVNHYLRQLGKAGRSRNLGIRPTVRGVAMNANEHPHGGGRGKSKGNRQPVNPSGRVLVSFTP